MADATPYSCGGTRSSLAPHLKPADPRRRTARGYTQCRTSATRRLCNPIVSAAAVAFSSRNGTNCAPPRTRAIPERRPHLTLDTAEHRWLATQVDRVRRRLTDLIEIEQGRYRARPTPRSAAILTELARLKSKSIRWLELEPLRAATALPPPSFASLQLLTAAGYREAYRACMTLSLGLRLEGGPLQLSVKDLNLLYEYWCYLALLRITAEETGAQVDPRRIFAVRDRGLSVLLCRGNESSMPFALPDGRRLTVRYNPKMGKDALVPQQPDLLLTT